MSSQTFARVSMLYNALKDIESIENESFGIKNSDSKLEAVLNAIQDVNKNELAEDITNQVIRYIKQGVTDLYTKELVNLNAEVGLDINIAPTTREMATDGGIKQSVDITFSKKVAQENDDKLIA